MELVNKYKDVKAVMYARVSSKEQFEEGYSIAAQLKLLEEYVSHPDRKISVVTEPFVDIETAKATGRKNFSRMIEFLKDNSEVNHILVEKTDRLYRNFRDYAILEDLDLTIHLVKENEVFNKNSRSHAKLIHGLKVLLAKNYIDNLSEEVKKGMNQKATDGSWPCKAPLGYLRNTSTHEIEVDTNKASLIKKLFQEYATGNSSLRQLVKFACDIGLRTTNGKKLNKAGVHRILKNNIYSGNFIYKEKLYEGKHKPIIDSHLFNSVQRILTNGSCSRRTKHTMAFQGLVKCELCGCSMTPDIKKGRYIYYRCTGYKLPCKNMVPESKLANLFGQFIADIQISPKMVKAIRLALLESHKDKNEFNKKALNSLRREYHTIKNRLEKAYIDRLDGIIDEAFWQEKYNEWNSKLAEINESMTVHRKANKNYLNEGMKLIEFANRAGELYLDRTNHERRQLIESIISHSTYSDGTLCVTYRKPFNYFVEGNKTKIKRG